MYGDCTSGAPRQLMTNFYVKINLEGAHEIPLTRTKLCAVAVSCIILYNRLWCDISTKILLTTRQYVREKMRRYSLGSRYSLQEMYQSAYVSVGVRCPPEEVRQFI